MEGTRGPATRSRCGGMALTVSQSGRIAKRSRAAPRRGRAVSRLPAARGPSRGRRRVAAAPVRGSLLLGAAAAGLRRPARAPPPRRASARGARRQPHGPDVHGRPERRLALRRASPRGLRQPADLARSEEHTSELQSLAYLVCRLLLEKKKKKKICYNVSIKEVVSRLDCSIHVSQWW